MGEKGSSEATEPRSLWWELSTHAPPTEQGLRSAETLLRSGGGRPLDPATRSYFDLRFGHEFGDVRVHTGASASSSARALGATAYTVGSNIVFREGAYAPHEHAGRRLLAHELAHVVQQTGGAGSGVATSGPARMPASSGALAISQREDPLEQEAERAAEQVTSSPSPSAPTITGRAVATLQRQDEHEQPALPPQERALRMFGWFMRGPYGSIGVNGVIRWLERSIAWARADPPNLIPIHAIPQALVLWLRERTRYENMRDRFAGMNGITRFVAEDRVNAALSAVESIQLRIGRWDYQSPLTGGLWDHYLRIVESAREHLMILNGEVATTPQLAGLERATNTALTVGTGIAALPVLPIAAQAMAAEAPILAYTLRRSAWQALSWALSNPGSAIAVADFGANTVYGMTTAGGVEPFVQSLATPEGATQFMASLLFMRSGMSGGGSSSGRGAPPPPARPTPARPTRQAPTSTSLVLAAIMQGPAETTPLGGRGQLLSRPAITLSQQASGGERATVATPAASSTSTSTSISTSATASSTATGSIVTPTAPATAQPSRWLGARVDIVSSDTGIHLSIAGLTPAATTSGSVSVAGAPPLNPIPGFDEPIAVGETYHTDSLPSQYDTPVWQVVGVWRNQAGQIVRVRARLRGVSSNQDPRPVSEFIRNHPRAAVALGLRRATIGQDTFAEFPTPASGTLPGAMPLREVATDDPGGSISRQDYFNTVAGGAIPMASQGGLAWHDRSHHFVGAAFVSGPLRRALAERLRILQQLGAIASEGRATGSFVRLHVTPEVDRALEVGVQNITDALSRPTAQIDRGELIQRLRIVAHGGDAGRPAYEFLGEVLSTAPTSSLSPQAAAERSANWYRNLSDSQRERMRQVLSARSPLLNEAQLQAEADNIIRTLQRLDGEPAR